MGCGNSTSNVQIALNEVAVKEEKVNKDASTESYNESIETNPCPSGNKGILVISGYSAQQNFNNSFINHFKSRGFSCFPLDEIIPESMKTRATIIQSCDVFIALISRPYHRTFACMEALSYAKDLRKPILCISLDPYFRPYGSLGALCAMSIQSLVLDRSNDDSTDEHQAIVKACEQLMQTLTKHCQTRNYEINSILDLEDQSTQFPRKIKPCSDTEKPVVLIGCTNEGLNVAQILHESLFVHQPSITIENLSKSDGISNVMNCEVFVAVLTPDFENNLMCRMILEEARLADKPIIPVIAVKKWKPTGWLGLINAGRIFFRIFDRETAFQPFYDTNRITDLRVEIEIAIQKQPSIDEREKKEIDNVNREIEKCKSILSHWPPERKSRRIESLKAKQPIRVTIPKPSADSYFEHTHHTITRIDRKAPPAILDQYGLPKRRMLDCMISYQWNKQEMVRQIFEDFHMRQLETWFDIWGSMQGGISDAMATGVECSKVLLVFLSTDYLQSVNCLLELRYAIQRGKAFVLLNTEANITLDPWISEAFNGFPHFDVYSYETVAQLINGVPMIDVIVQSIRLLAQAQPIDTIDDCSNELLELRSLLDDARDAVHLQTGQQRYKICTRCGQQYDEYFKDGCKKHNAYFLGGGGGLLEDHWVCCRQQKSDSPGCVPCVHIDQPRTFTEDPDYGTSTWNPA